MITLFHEIVGTDSVGHSMGAQLSASVPEMKIAKNQEEDYQCMVCSNWAKKEEDNYRFDSRRK